MIGITSSETTTAEPRLRLYLKPSRARATLCRSSLDWGPPWHSTLKARASTGRGGGVREGLSASCHPSAPGNTRAGVPAPPWVPPEGLVSACRRGLGLRGTRKPSFSLQNFRGHSRNQNRTLPGPGLTAGSQGAMGVAGSPRLQIRQSSSRLQSLQLQAAAVALLGPGGRGRVWRKRVLGNDLGAERLSRPAPGHRCPSALSRAGRRFLFV